MEMRETSSVTSVHPLMTALGRGLPITLLVDLVDPNGPRSAEMFEREGTPSSTVSAVDRIA
jgi:hypothetical protein